MSKYVKLQKTKVIRSKKDASHTENSQYWDDVKKHGEIGENDASEGWREHPQANPDMLPDMEATAPSTPQLIMGEAVEHLQGRQREVYLLLIREGKTYEETSEILGITRGAVQTYEKRAIKFIEQYCKNAIAKGRV